MAAVKLTKTSIRLLEQPESMRSIVGAFGGEKKTGGNRDAVFTEWRSLIAS